MPEIIKQEDGTEKTVYTQEEFESLKTEHTQVKKNLEDLSEKDFNFSLLRNKKEELEKELDNFKNNPPALQPKELTDGEKAEINKLANGDEKLAEAISFQFQNNLIAVQANTAEEISKKVSMASALAAQGNGGSSGGQEFHPGGGGGGGQAPNFAGKPDAIPAEVKSLGKKLGLTDEDLNNPDYDKQNFTVDPSKDGDGSNL